MFYNDNVLRIYDVTKVGHLINIILLNSLLMSSAKVCINNCQNIPKYKHIRQNIDFFGFPSRRGSEDIDAIPMSEELESALESSITRLLESSPIEYQLTRVK